MTDTLELLLSRRSVTAKDMVEPGPNPEQLDKILRAGLRVPDHGKLGPWRLILIQGEHRAELGEILAAALTRAEADAPAARIDLARRTFTRAPLAVAVVSAPVVAKIPQWEQELSAGAVAMNLLVAVHASGFAGQWLTEWYSYNPEVAAALGLADSERLAGFVYMGSAKAAPSERPRPGLEERLSVWSGSQGN